MLDVTEKIKLHGKSNAFNPIMAIKSYSQAFDVTLDKAKIIINEFINNGQLIQNVSVANKDKLYELHKSGIESVILHIPIDSNNELILQFNENGCTQRTGRLAASYSISDIKSALGGKTWKIIDGSIMSADGEQCLVIENDELANACISYLCK